MRDTLTHTVALIGVLLAAASAGLAQDGAGSLAAWDFEDGIGNWGAVESSGAQIELAVGPEAAAEGLCALCVSYHQRPPEVAGLGGGSPLAWCPLTEPLAEAPTCLEFAVRTKVATALMVIVAESKRAPYLRWIWVEPGQWRDVRIYMAEMAIHLAAAPTARGPLKSADLMGWGLVDGLHSSFRSSSKALVALPEPQGNELRLDAARLTLRQPPGELPICDPSREVPSFYPLVNVTQPIERVAGADGAPAWRVPYRLPAGKLGEVLWCTGPNLTGGTAGVELSLRSALQTDLVLGVRVLDEGRFGLPVRLEAGKAVVLRVPWGALRPCRYGRMLGGPEAEAAAPPVVEKVRDIMVWETSALDAQGEGQENALDVGRVRYLPAGG